MSIGDKWIKMDEGWGDVGEIGEYLEIECLGFDFLAEVVYKGLPNNCKAVVQLYNNGEIVEIKKGNTNEIQNEFKFDSVQEAKAWAEKQTKNQVRSFLIKTAAAMHQLRLDYLDE